MTGIREFFAKFKFQSADLSQFIECLQVGIYKKRSNFYMK